MHRHFYFFYYLSSKKNIEHNKFFNLYPLKQNKKVYLKKICEKSKDKTTSLNQNSLTNFSAATLSSGLYFADHSQLPWGHLFIGSKAWRGNAFLSQANKEKKRENYPRILVGRTQAHPHDAGQAALHIKEQILHSWETGFIHFPRWKEILLPRFKGPVKPYSFYQNGLILIIL